MEWWRSNHEKVFVVWEKVCTPKIQGGLSIISIQEWKKACLIKLLWNLTGKRDNL